MSGDVEHAHATDEDFDAFVVQSAARMLRAGHEVGAIVRYLETVTPDTT